MDRNTNTDETVLGRTTLGQTAVNENATQQRPQPNLNFGNLDLSTIISEPELNKKVPLPKNLTPYEAKTHKTIQKSFESFLDSSLTPPPATGENSWTRFTHFLSNIYYTWTCDFWLNHKFLSQVLSKHLKSKGYTVVATSFQPFQDFLTAINMELGSNSSLVLMRWIARLVFDNSIKLSQHLQIFRQAAEREYERGIWLTDPQIFQTLQDKILSSPFSEAWQVVKRLSPDQPPEETAISCKSQPKYPFIRSNTTPSPTPILCLDPHSQEFRDVAQDLQQQTMCLACASTDHSSLNCP